MSPNVSDGRRDGMRGGQPGIRVVAAVQETGGAQAILPAIRELVGDTTVRVTVAASGKAYDLFSGIDLSPATVTPVGDFEYLDNEWAFEFLRSENPDALLLGTTWGPSIDKQLIAAANRLGIPSLSVIDMWSNYRERFDIGASGVVSLPTKIAVIDQRAFKQAVEAGLPVSSLVVTGQPHLESLVALVVTASKQAKDVRESWNVSPGSPVIVFVSEAIEKDFGPSTPHYRGYTESDALVGLLRSVSSIALPGGERLQIVVKPHPEQTEDDFVLNRLFKTESLIFERTAAGLPCIIAADVVVGMTSMLLIESAIAGQRTVSYQPGVIDPNVFEGTASGLMPLASTVEQLTEALKQSLSHTGLTTSADRKRFDMTGAARNVARAVLELAVSKAEEAPV